MKYLSIIIILTTSCSLHSEELDCKSTEKQTYSSCISNKFENIKSQVDNKYDEITVRLSRNNMFKDLKLNIKDSHKNWELLTNNDCGSYAYFVEKSSPVYRDIYLQCKLDIYNQRLGYYISLNGMLDDFM